MISKFRRMLNEEAELTINVRYSQPPAFFEAGLSLSLSLSRIRWINRSVQVHPINIRCLIFLLYTHILLLSFKFVGLWFSTELIAEIITVFNGP
ncbi:hypothetical protein L6452_04806 [Arctium lappa]|uniref:Uncharacterized protein n=1 Tax=Arctium lappa TaxID=4217 RepID=A0ACB9EFN8_ARCLA|nr:hypothetical protein L6452_04806 [Arctium lappa]